ncbi:MAG: transposase [Candidatus Freyrarchaeum guaymaensis]
MVSDDDKALLKAIREVFPRVPLQYCHSHFLRNLGEDLMGEHHRRVAEAAEEAKNLTLAAVNPEERVRETAAWAESLRGAPREELRPSPRGSAATRNASTPTQGSGAAPEASPSSRGGSGRRGERREPRNTPQGPLPQNPLAPPPRASTKTS